MPSRADAKWCSAACRKAASRALALETWGHVDPPSIRSEHWSADRAAATGCGSLTRREAYLADLRVRLLADLDEPEHLDQRAAMAEWQDGRR